MCTTWQITHFVTLIDIDVQANTSKLLLLQHNCLNYAEFIKMTLELQNYHFALGGNILDLIFKNYYEVIFIRISWIYNLYDNLMSF